MLEKWNFYFHQKHFVKSTILWKFCQKSMRVNFCNFHTECILIFNITKHLYYLLEVNKIPFTPPKVDIATKIGIRKAKYPNILSAKVWKIRKKIRFFFYVKLNFEFSHKEINHHLTKWSWAHQKNLQSEKNYFVKTKVSSFILVNLTEN